MDRRRRRDREPEPTAPPEALAQRARRMGVVYLEPESGLQGQDRIRARRRAQQRVLDAGRHPDSGSAVSIVRSRHLITDQQEEAGNRLFQLRGSVLGHTSAGALDYGYSAPLTEVDGELAIARHHFETCGDPEEIERRREQQLFRALDQLGQWTNPRRQEVYRLCVEDQLPLWLRLYADGSHEVLSPTRHQHLRDGLEAVARAFGFAASA